MKKVNLSIFVTSRESLNPQEDMNFINQAIMKGDVHVFKTRTQSQMKEIQDAIGEVTTPAQHFELGQKFVDIAERDGLRCRLRRGTNRKSGHELWYFGMYSQEEFDAINEKAEAEARGEIH